MSGYAPSFIDGRANGLNQIDSGYAPNFIVGQVLSAGLLSQIDAGYPPSFYVAVNFVEAAVKTTFSLRGSIKSGVKTPFSLLKSVKNTIKTTFDLLGNNPVQQTVRTTFDLIGNGSAIELPIDATITLNGSEIDIITANISQDEDSWTWSFNATIASQESWNKIKPTNGYYPDAILTVRGIVFNVMVEGIQRSRRDVSNTWSINGRGITARLDGKYASGVNTSWRNVNAQVIIQLLCDSAGLTLDYQETDWQISELEGQGRYPIEIINEIATAVGSVVQTSPAGALIIRPRYPQKPTEYANATPDFTITDLDDYIMLDEQWLDRDNYNVISVGDSEVDEGSQLTIDSGDDIDSDGNKIGENKRIKIYAVPFIEEIALDDSAEGYLTLIYQGITTEQIDIEAFEIVNGEGSVSKPFYGLLSSDYIHTDLGGMTVSESGKITTEIAGQSLINLSYTTKYHQYSAIRTGSDKHLQVFAEVEE